MDEWEHLCQKAILFGTIIEQDLTLDRELFLSDVVIKTK